MSEVSFTVLGTPTGKGRPRFNRQSGRTYTPAKTEAAEGDVRGAFLAQVGFPTGLTGPLVMYVDAYFARPGGHYKRDGTFSAEGKRQPYPAKRPDADNLVKLVCDALEGLAYRNDAQIVDVSVRKRWLVGREDVERTVVFIQQARHVVLEAVAA